MSKTISIEWDLANGVLPVIRLSSRNLSTTWTQGEMEDLISDLQTALDEARAASDEAVREYREKLRLGVMP